jgi:hypothetical protein
VLTPSQWCTARSAQFGKEFRSYLKKQKRTELLGVLERHSPFLEEYRWQSPALSGGLLLGIITGKLPGAQAAKTAGKEKANEAQGGARDTEKVRGLDGVKNKAVDHARGGWVV